MKEGITEANGIDRYIINESVIIIIGGVRMTIGEIQKTMIGIDNAKM